MLASRDHVLDQGQGPTVPAHLAQKAEGFRRRQHGGIPQRSSLPWDPQLFQPFPRGCVGHSKCPPFGSRSEAPVSGGDPPSTVTVLLPAVFLGPGTLLPHEALRPPLSQQRASSVKPVPSGLGRGSLRVGLSLLLCCAPPPPAPPAVGHGILGWPPWQACDDRRSPWPVPGIQAPHAGCRPCFCWGVALSPGMAEVRAGSRAEMSIHGSDHLLGPSLSFSLCSSGMLPFPWVRGCPR